MPPKADDGRVRSAQPRDLDRVAALWTAITRHHEDLDPLFIMRPGAEGELRELLAALYRDRDAEILVYDDAGDLPGMCIVRIDHAPPIMHEVERAEITDLGVRSSERRRGIASALVEAALEWVRASGVERVEVQVACGNHEGQGFWRARGFEDLMDVLHKRL
ncbi:MAG: GNAT family N-acetyltransferase [Deltaproteobacteria bacterium]|nr:GNAT family N-acetyltransferase [Deltaproteobacteria bacterium]MBW2420775.1 GNAT family N-acetyltransferase [Deltaproteobacteria bacterium]